MIEAAFPQASTPVRHMNTTAMLIALVVLLPAFGIAAWAWIHMVRLDHDMRFAAGFEGLDFEIHDAPFMQRRG